MLSTATLLPIAAKSQDKIDTVTLTTEKKAEVNEKIEKDLSHKEKIGIGGCCILATTLLVGALAWLGKLHHQTFGDELAGERERLRN